MLIHALYVFLSLYMYCMCELLSGEMLSLIPTGAPVVEMNHVCPTVIMSLNNSVLATCKHRHLS